jgi:hypothetical protein
MAAEKLGAYILDHDEKSFLIKDSQLQKIEYSSGKVMVAGEEKNDLLDRDYNNYIDFKLSFDELNFKNEDAAVEKLEAVAADISKIKRDNHIKKDTWHKQFRITDKFDSLSDAEKNKAVENLVEDNYKDSDREIPKVRSYERTQDGWGKEIVKVKLERNYNKNLNLDDSIISIHTKSRDEIQKKEHYKVKPHIHLTINRNNNWGRKYAYLKQELSQVIRKNNLTSSHNVDIKRDRGSKEYKEYRVLKDRLSSFSWVVSKHEEGKYILKQLKQYERNEKSVKLNNVEQKLNRYIELGGSYDFARKLQTNLKEKLNFEIDIKEPQGYKEASKTIDQGNYKQIINEVRSQALNGERISERYKEFAKEVLNKDEVNIKELAAARGIQAAVKNRGYHLDKNFNKVIDRQKINRLCDKEINVIDRIEKKERYNKVREKVKAKEYLNQDKLRKDLKDAGVEDCKKTFGASEVAVVFQGKEEYIRDNLKNDKFLAASEVKEEIEAMDIEITDSWKEKIADKIYKEQAPVAEKQQELKEIDKKLKNLEKQRAATRANLNRLQSTCKRIGFELKNLTNDHSRDELLDEINESSDKIKAGISILLAIYRHQAAASKFKKVKNIAKKESKSKVSDWNKYFDKQLKNIEIIEKAAAENNLNINKVKKLEEGYKITLKEDEIKFRIEDTEQAFNAYRVKKAYYKKINEADKQIKQYDKEFILDSNIDTMKKEIKKLEKQKGDVKTGGILAKITGKAKKAKAKRKAIEKKIAAKKSKLEQLDKRFNKLKKLKKKRLEYFKYVEAGRTKLKELKEKTKESKVKKINKKKEKDHNLSR